MLHSPLLLAGILGLGGVELSMLIAIFGLIFGCLMGIVGMYFAHQRQRLWHETARLALEKGQPIPAPEDAPRAGRGSGTDLNQHDLRGGLVLMAVGVGVYFFLGAVSDGRVAWLGAVPGFIGVALVLHWMLMRILGSKKDNVPPPNP